jgi:hypothetical protein
VLKNRVATSSPTDSVPIPIAYTIYGIGMQIARDFRVGFEDSEVYGL